MEKSTWTASAPRRRARASSPKARINPQAIRSVMELRIEMGVMKPDVGPAEKFYDAAIGAQRRDCRRRKRARQ
jgi:hypothetical protein